MPTHPKRTIWIVSTVACLLFFAAACTGAQPMEKPSATPGILRETSTPSLEPTVTSTATATPTLTPSPLPTTTPTVTPTPLPWAETGITADNAARLKELAQWGRGKISQIEATASRTMVLSSLGIYLYQSEPLHLVSAYPGAVRFEISPDAAKAALIYPDGAVSLVGLENGEMLFNILIEAEFPNYLCPKCDAERQKAIKTYHYTEAPAAFSQDSRLFALAAVDQAIYVWNTEDGTQTARLYHDTALNNIQVAFTPDGQRLLSTNRGRYPMVFGWSLETQKLVWYQKGEGDVDPKFFSLDGRLFGLTFIPWGVTQPVVKLYRLEDGVLVGGLGGTFAEHPYSPDSTLIASSNVGSIIITRVQPDFQTLRTIYLNVDHAQVVFSEDGSQVVVNGGEKVYNAADYSLVSEGQPTVVAPTPVPTEDITRWLAQSHLPDPIGLLVLADNSVYVWGKPQPSWGANAPVWGGVSPIWRWAPLTGEVNWVIADGKTTGGMAVSADGEEVAICFEDRLEVTGFMGGEKLNFERCFDRTALAFLPDGSGLARSQSTRISVIDLPSGEKRQDYISSGYPVHLIEFSADSSLMVSSGCGPGCRSDIRLWQMEPAQGISLEPDGSLKPFTDMAITSDINKMIGIKEFTWIWDTHTGQLLGRVDLIGNRLAVSPDDRLLAIGDWGGKVSLVSLETRQVVASFQAHASSIVDMAFTADGANLVTLAEDGSVKVWGLP